MTSRQGEHRQPKAWGNGLAYLTLCAVLLIALFFVVSPIRLANPVSHHAQTLLKIDVDLGATIEPLNARIMKHLPPDLGTKDMVVTSVASGGRAAAAGLRVGDIVETIDGQAPGDLDDAESALAVDPTSVVVDRAGARIILPLPVRAANPRR